MTTGLEPTLTADEARAWAHRYVQAAVAQLRPAPRLEPAPSADSPCTDLVPVGRISIAVDVWLRDVPVDGFFEVLPAYWAAEGFQVLDDQRAAGLDRRYAVQHPADGFRLRLRENRQGSLVLTASSPCLWPDGAPPPGTAPAP